MSLSDLSKFRADAPESSPEDDLTGPVVPRYSGRILAFDQSLANTGWAMIERTGSISACGNLKTVAVAEGYEDTLQRATRLFTQYRDLIRSMGPTLVVHEAPPLGVIKGNGESSLVTAVAVRNACTALGIKVRMYHSQKAKKRWAGKPGAKKPEVAAALKRLDPTLAGRKPMNQAITDAIAVGWLGLEEA